LDDGGKLAPGGTVVKGFGGELDRYDVNRERVFDRQYQSGRRRRARNVDRTCRDSESNLETAKMYKLVQTSGTRFVPFR
jgi:hypothetical protein